MQLAGRSLMRFDMFFNRALYMGMKVMSVCNARRCRINSATIQLFNFCGKSRKKESFLFIILKMKFKNIDLVVKSANQISFDKYQ